ncbi:DUF5134 domain-containing protein [Paraburkholderia sp. 1N]|uniref:DUF5134 domain-containing protein n=1 Tax=Paraburkholderia solitsugae TaxID=2675748 RepID=A0ABX2C1X5_9BURK|nr:DUF5134 domain-containing protein [Paraburkholderia solitsugae]
MMSPPWLLGILTAVMLVITAVSAIRLGAAQLPASWFSAVKPDGSCSSSRCSNGADTDLAYLLMGVAMAGMLAPSMRTLPSHAWEAIFGLLTMWFAWRLLADTWVNGRRSLASVYRAAHVLHCAAMVYMFAALTMTDDICRGGARSSSIVRSFKLPTLALAFVLVCYGAWDVLAQLADRHDSRRNISLGAASARSTVPTVACRVAMTVSMAVMLLIIR